jgi:hypothetical protein
MSTTSVVDAIRPEQAPSAQEDLRKQRNDEIRRRIVRVIAVLAVLYVLSLLS